MKNNIIVLSLFLSLFTAISAKESLSILPIPSSVELKGGTINIYQKIKIKSSNAKATKIYLSEALKDRFGIQTVGVFNWSTPTISLLNKNTNPKSEK